MKKLLIPITAAAALLSGPAALAQASAQIAAGKTKPSPLAPSEIVAAAPRGDWVAIAPTDLLVMDLAPDAKGKARRVVIQLMQPPFSQGWTGNIRTLAKAHWWDGLSINRVQDNYVVQWGDGDAEDKVKAKPLPAGLVTVPEAQYTFKNRRGRLTQLPTGSFDEAPAFRPWSRWGNSAEDAYANATGLLQTFPFATDFENIWPVHCYGMVGVGRDLSPNTGTGAELYVVIGHAPRHLDRNIALVGRVIEGIEHLSSLPRGHGALGFYDLSQGDERVPIRSIRLASDLESDKPLPTYEYLSTESRTFAKYADARANRRDAFFIRPAGGADICNIPVPVRRAK